jgi:hypothetical protein
MKNASRHLRRRHNLLIVERTAEEIQIEIGSAFPLVNEIQIEVQGRVLVRGIPGRATVTHCEIREALSGCVASIVSAIRLALENTPPELSGDICDRGMVLAGRGSTGVRVGVVLHLHRYLVPLIGNTGGSKKTATFVKLMDEHSSAISLPKRAFDSVFHQLVPSGSVMVSNN